MLGIEDEKGHESQVRHFDGRHTVKNTIDPHIVVPIYEDSEHCQALRDESYPKDDKVAIVLDLSS